MFSVGSRYKKLRRARVGPRRTVFAFQTLPPRYRLCHRGENQHTEPSSTSTIPKLLNFCSGSYRLTKCTPTFPSQPIPAAVRLSHYRQQDAATERAGKQEAPALKIKCCHATTFRGNKLFASPAQRKIKNTACRAAVFLWIYLPLHLSASLFCLYFRGCDSWLHPWVYSLGFLLLLHVFNLLPWARMR